MSVSPLIPSSPPPTNASPSPLVLVSPDASGGSRAPTSLEAGGPHSTSQRADPHTPGLRLTHDSSPSGGYSTAPPSTNSAYTPTPTAQTPHTSTSATSTPASTHHPALNHFSPPPTASALHLPPHPNSKSTMPTSYSASPPHPLSMTERRATIDLTNGSQQYAVRTMLVAAHGSTSKPSARRSFGSATLPNPHTHAHAASSSAANVGLSPHQFTHRHAHLLPAPSATHGPGGGAREGSMSMQKLSMSASPPLVPRVRLPMGMASTPSPPLIQRSVSVSTTNLAPTNLSSTFNNHIDVPALPLCLTRILSNGSPPCSARTFSNGPSRHGSPSPLPNASQCSSRQTSRQGSRHGSRNSSRPSSRNGGSSFRGAHSRPSSRPGTRPSSRTGSRRASLDGLIHASPLFVGGGDLVEALAANGARARARTRPRARGQGGDEAEAEESEEENSNGLLNGSGGLDDSMQPSEPDHTDSNNLDTSMRDVYSEIGSDEDGETETLAALQAIPVRRLCVTTDDATPSPAPGDHHGRFKIPSLVLPTPTSGAPSARASTKSQSTPNPAHGGGPRSRFLDLKLVCPSPDRMAPALSKEDKLLYFSRLCSLLTPYLCVGSRLIAQDWSKFVAHGITHVVNVAGDICENYFEHFRAEDVVVPSSNAGSPHGRDRAHSASALPPPLRQTRPVKYMRLFLLDTQDEDLMCVLYPVMEFIESARAEERLQLGPAELAAMGPALASVAEALARGSDVPPPLPPALSLPPTAASAAAAAASAFPPNSISSRVLIHCQQGVSRSTALCIAYLMLEGGREYEEAYAIVRGIRGICRPNFGFIAQLKAWKLRMDGWTSRSKPVLYRVGPHCSRDRRIVLKLVDRLKAAYVDSRSIFVLVTRERVTTWIGSEVLPQQETCYLAQVAKHLARIRRWEHAPEVEVVVRQSDEQQYAREHPSAYEVRDANDVEAHTYSPATPEAFERSPSQTLFLATLLSPTTLHSLNLQASSGSSHATASSSPMEQSAAGGSTQSSSVVGTPMVSPAKPPMHPPTVVISSPMPSSAMHGIHVFPSPARGPPSCSSSASTISVACTPMSARSPIGLAPFTPIGSDGHPITTWQAASRTFWRILNGSPVETLTRVEYDDDYPTHEWLAMHLARQASQEDAHRRTKQPAQHHPHPLVTSSSIGSMVAASATSATSASSGGHSRMLQRRNSRDSAHRIIMRRRSSAAGTAAAAAAAAAAAHAAFVTSSPFKGALNSPVVEDEPMGEEGLFHSPSPAGGVSLPHPRARMRRQNSYEADADDSDEDEAMEQAPDEESASALPLSTRLSLGGIGDDADDAEADRSQEEIVSSPVAPRVPLNPLMIGLGDPVPVGFVANSSMFQDDSSSSGSEEEEQPHSPVVNETRERGGSLRPHTSFASATPQNEDSAIAVGAEDAEVTAAAASSPTEFVGSLYAYPGFEELTSFDLDDLLHSSVLLLEWRPRTRSEEDDDSSSDEEVAEVRNVRLRQEAAQGHVSSTSPSKPLSQSSLSLPAESSSQLLPATNGPSSPSPSRAYHVWFGSATERQRSPVRMAFAQSIVREYLRTRRDQEAAAEAVDSDIPLQQRTDGDEGPVVVVEEDGRESEEFLSAFDAE